MSLALSSQDLAFRDEVRAFLDRELTPDLRDAGRRCGGVFNDYDIGNRWTRILAKQGWSVPHWPVEHGGTNWTPMQHYIFACELAAADAPLLAAFGPHMVGPVIIAFGTEEQKQRWLPGIRTGEDYWAQGYSEPQSGSDLASLQCRAVRDGDHYVINGTKIWTTHAHFANKLFCLVRTGQGTRRQEGISFLCFDLKTPGVTIRPIISLAGDHELNQVFFDEVRVPASALIGEENAGWRIAKFLLQHERGQPWSPLLRTRLRRMHEAATTAFGAPPADPLGWADIRRKLAAAECGIDALEAMELRALAAQSRGEPPGIAPSIGKVLGSELRQSMTELAVEISGHYAHARPPLGEWMAQDHALLEQAVTSMSNYLNDRAASIYAGTNEVQRNIIAQQVLTSG